MSDRVYAHMNGDCWPSQCAICIREDEDEANELAARVHNHPPYRPVCNERLVDQQLRGACLDDDGTDIA